MNNHPSDNPAFVAAHRAAFHSLAAPTTLTAGQHVWILDHYYPGVVVHVASDGGAVVRTPQWGTDKPMVGDGRLVDIRLTYLREHYSQLRVDLASAAFWPQPYGWVDAQAEAAAASGAQHHVAVAIANNPDDVVIGGRGEGAVVVTAPTTASLDWVTMFTITSPKGARPTLDAIEAAGHRARKHPTVDAAGTNIRTLEPYEVWQTTMPLTEVKRLAESSGGVVIEPMLDTTVEL